MNVLKIVASFRAQLLAVSALFIIVACGGGSGTAPTSAINPQPSTSTGTVGLLFTDAPTDEFSAILLNVTDAILIGGDGKQHLLFQGSEPIDLLDLTNFNEPIVFGEVSAGNYTKLRLIVSELELVPKDGGESIFPKLPGNGKIDLLQADGFNVLPGRTLMIEVDMDANKSIKITSAGNSGKYQFRPVVKVKIMDGDMPHKLARLEGSVDEILSDPAGSFVLCDIDSPEHCVTVATNSDTGVFNDQGLVTDFSTLESGNMVVAIGHYETDPAIVLNAVVLEIGGNSEQVKGNVVSNPMNDQFLMVVDDNGDLIVELQPGTDVLAGTKFYDASGAIDRDAIVIGVDVEIEGVKPADADPDVIRAALVFLEADPDEQISGTIATDPDDIARTFDLTLEDLSSVCVQVNEDADILLVDATNSVVTMGDFTDLAAEQIVDVFGEPAENCFNANEVIVTLP